jgi:hypothetical protein
MRDYYHTLASLSLATKDTDVSSGDSMKFDSINARSRFTKYQTGHNKDDLEACFQPSADFAAEDDFIPYIEHSADGSTWTKVLTGEQVGAPAKAAKTYTLPMPKDHKQYLRLGATPKSSGTFTAKTLQVWFEYGNQQL